jgi:glucose-6-phosphate-specific signal transduction histidine kinase
MKTTPLRLAALLVLISLIGWLDYVTGDELDLFILYFVPIVWAAWNIGPRAGVAIAMVGMVLWFSANVYLGNAYTHPLFGVWGGLVMLATFSAAALATSRIHLLLERERQLNRKLAEALAKVKKLSGRLPICIGCKSIRDEGGQWHEIEEYFTQQSEDDFIFSQAVCPYCRVNDPGGSGDARRLPPQPALVA